MASRKASFYKRKNFEHAKTKKKKSECQIPRVVEDDVGSAEDSLESDHEQEPAQKKVRWENTEHDEDRSVDDGQERDGTESGVSQITENKVVLAIYSQNFRVGCAYYDPVKLTMYVLEDTAESSHSDTSRLLLEQISPDVTLTSSRADEASIDIMRDFMEVSDGLFQIRPAKEFIPAKGRDRLLSLNFLLELPSEEVNASVAHSSSDTPSNAYDFMQRRRELAGDPSLKRWNASIRIGNFASLEASPLCMSAVGALLDHLAKVRAMADLDNEGVGGLEIRAIESICLEQFMQINADALSSLQVFDTESHASVHSDKTKEGLSLFGILNTTCTSLGRILLRQWLLRPSLSIPIITARHDTVECLNRPENIVTADAMHNHLKGLKNIPRTLRQLKSGKASLYEWQGLVKFTFHAALLRETLTELNYVGEVAILKKLIAVLDVTSFKEVGNAVHETIDWEESTHAGRVCVRPNIDEELDKWKHIYNGIDGVLSRVAEQIGETVPADYASSLNVVYFPQLGFLICVPMQEAWTTERGVDVLDGWIFQFSSETHVYFKSQQMHDMDHHIGDLHPFIVDREIEIIQALLDKILLFDDAIAQACDACAELDCLLCFAGSSRAYNYCRPVMTEDNIIDIRQGRHPLQEQVVDTFVPNDILVKGGAGIGAPFEDSEDSAMANVKSVLVLTGANACGKSVYLKQTALIQYMAQIGCFVPAESATLGIVDKIFTRVQTRESVSKIQSAFMIDLNQVSLALRNSTPRSLILLDEFGKGTISSDGAGLFCGVLRSLLARGAACPKVLSATHFHDVFRADLLDPALPISFLHMQILLPDTSEEEGNKEADTAHEEADLENGDDGTRAHLRLKRGETITYLYRVAPGLSLESHAARCAQLFGLPPAIVRRAEYVSALLSTHNLTRLLDEDMTSGEAAELAQAEAVCRRFMAWDLSDSGAAETGSVKEKLSKVLERSVADSETEGVDETGGA
ncbi:muts domain V-domain-containing protein [Phellopilus nigrolimitatus]|nr:muts domain V-domain-containing protein [Phellopilus nigrolimitatus]